MGIVLLFKRVFFVGVPACETRKTLSIWQAVSKSRKFRDMGVPGHQKGGVAGLMELLDIVAVCREFKTNL